jgi:hypothetical protein
MSADEICEMAEALEIPERFTTTSRYSFTSIEALALLCACFQSAGDLYHLSMIYDRSQSSITECVNELVMYVDTSVAAALARNRLKPIAELILAEAKPSHGTARAATQLSCNSSSETGLSRLSWYNNDGV